MLTTAEFAQKIKSKYPEYSKVPDDVLVQKIIEKYPVYKSQVGMQMAPWEKIAADTAAKTNQSPAVQEMSKTGLTPYAENPGAKTFSQKFVQNLEAAPSGIFGDKSFTGMLPESSGLPEVGRLLESAGKNFVSGVETVAHGGNEIANAVTDNKSLEQKVSEGVGGVADVIGGGMGAAFAPATGAIQNTPIINKGFDLLGQGVNHISTWLSNEIGGTPDQKEALAKSLNNLFTLGTIQYGPRVTNTLSPYVKKAADFIEEKTPSIGIQTGGYNPTIVKQAASAGIDKLPLSAQTTSGLVHSLEALQRNGFFPKELAKIAENADAQMKASVSKLTEELSKPSDVSQFDFGQNVKDAMDSSVENFKTQKNVLYDGAQKILDNSKLKTKFISPKEIPEANAALDDLIGSSKKSLLPSPALDLYKGLKAGLNGRKLTLETIRQTLKDVGKKLQNNNDPIVTGDRAGLSKVYAALSKDLDNIYSSKVPEFKEAISSANSFYKQNIELINGKFGKMIDGSTPEQIYNKFIKPNNPTALSAMKTLIGDESFQKISAVFLKDLVEKSMKDGEFNIDTFNKNISKWDEQTLNTLLTPEQINKLNEVKNQFSNLKNIQEAIDTGSKKFNGSQTAFLSRVDKLKSFMATGGAGGAAISFAGAGGGIVGALALGTLLYFLSDFGLSKLLSSDFGRKLFTTGFKLPGGAAPAKLVDFLSKHSDVVQNIMDASVSSASKNLNESDSQKE